MFSTPRAGEFLDPRALQSLTGQPTERFAEVVLKELVDNALDAAESAGMHPDLTIATDTTGEELLVTVTDNGPGLPPEVVEQVLDFGNLVSDKAAYRSPTRGLQGNALKTIFGIPAALGATTPVVIEACGVRHEVALELDPAGAVVVRHDRAPSTRTVGTAVTVALPASSDDEFDPAAWVRSFALVNPHAAIKHAHGGDPAAADSYKPTVGDAWRKPVPTDPLQIHWYDEAALARLVFAHVGAARNGDRDLPLGEFVRSFAGLSSTAKAKTVIASLPGITHLSGFEQRRDQVPTLLAAMRAECRPPAPSKLGHVPEEHYRAHFDTWYGVNRWWFKRCRVTDDAGQPWTVEVGVADTETAGGVFFAVNYSASFGDPLGRVQLRAGEQTGYGSDGFLRSCDAVPRYSNDGRRAAVVHVISPAVEFTDKGKVALVVPQCVADAAAEALAHVGRILRNEKRAADRDARKAENRRQQQIKRANPAGMSLRDAVFTVMREAVNETSGGGESVFSTRTLYYHVRPRIQALTDRRLTQDYFSQNLAIAWEREHGPIDGMYYESRGALHEPHTGEVVPLGTREVVAYIPPDWTYNKILYVEKQGLHPVLEGSGLGERYDMAIIAGEGFSSTACRDLLAAAGGRDWRIFVLHDADPGGYGIARTLGEATARMPDHSVEVVDLGLSVADAVRYRLETEQFTRQKALPSTLRLNEAELRWFTGTRIHSGDKPQWACTRVELNAFTSPQLIEYIEAGLAAQNATDKVVPPGDVLMKHAANTYDFALGCAVDRMIAELVDRDRLLATLRAEFSYRPDSVELDRHVREVLNIHREQLWRVPAGDAAGIQVERHRVVLRARLVGLLGNNADGSGGRR